MSKRLIDFAKYFVESKIDATNFAEPYMLMWKEDRDTKALSIDGKEIDEASSTIFCLADCFNPDSDRENYELDTLRIFIHAVFKAFMSLKVVCTHSHITAVIIFRCGNIDRCFVCNPIMAITPISARASTIAGGARITIITVNRTVRCIMVIPAWSLI